MTCFWDSIISLCRSAVPATPNNNTKNNTPNIVNAIVLMRILLHIPYGTSSTSANYFTNAVVITHDSDNVSVPAIPSRRNTDTFQRFR